MLSNIGVKILEMILTKLGSFLYSIILKWIENKKDEKDIKDVFQKEEEGSVAGGLNDIFNR